MDTPASRAPTADQRDFRAVKGRFLALNRERLRRTEDALRWRQREVLELLPLLFHINHPLLPGFVSKETPSGIPDYTPSKAALKAAKALSKGFSYRRRAYRSYQIQALYLMGSTGTIAHAGDSDLDLWVCHDPELDEDQLDLLREKARGIEHWAQSLDLEAHIFLVDTERFRRGDHGALTSESSGSMLHDLLLDEFYRTGLLLAGCYPLWWLVPPEEEHNYADYTASLKAKRFVHAKEHIDFGGPAGVTSEEFYGATLWLLYKGIDSPYKSLLKILLMEVYASAYPDIELASLGLKRAVYAGNTDLDELDPYLMMFAKVQAYLAARGESERLELARRCLYFKVDVALTAGQQGRRGEWRRERMTRLVSDWGWTQTKLLMLDSRKTWRVRRVGEERKELVNEFMRSYRYLSQFVDSHCGSAQLIGARDLNALGRKLFAAFERRAGKVDIVVRGIADELYETHLSLHQVNDGEGRQIWMVFSGIVPAEEIAMHAPLKRAHSAVELLAWCHFNRIVEPNTVVALYAQDSDLSVRELRALIDHMRRLFPDAALAQTDMAVLSRPVEILAVASFINVGLDPFSAHTRRGRHLTSARTDAFKYGGLFENLALSIDQVIVTSWQEVLTFHYAGVGGLLDSLGEYMRWSPPSSGRPPPGLNALSFSCYRGGAIARRVERLFEEVIDCYYNGPYAATARYIVGVERAFYVLSLEGDALQHRRVPDYHSLLLYLGEPHTEFSPVVFDQETLEDTVLPTLYAHNRAGVIQLFYVLSSRAGASGVVSSGGVPSTKGGSQPGSTQGGEIEVYVLDEHGALSCHRQSYFDTATLLTQWQRFFGAIAERIGLRGDSGAAERRPVEYHRVQRRGRGQYALTRHEINQYLRGGDYFDVQAIGELVDAELRFTLFCDDREFSPLEFGDGLCEAVARYIVERRASRQRYPIYLTDIDLPGAAGDGGPATIHYLMHKRDIEHRLNAALERL